MLHIHAGEVSSSPPLLFSLALLLTQAPFGFGVNLFAVASRSPPSFQALFESKTVTPAYAVNVSTRGIPLAGLTQRPVALD